MRRKWKRAAELLADAKRPVILCGGGCITANASQQVQELAELLGAAVVTTWNGKGTIAEDHPLYGHYPGHPGTSVGNALCRSADLLLAVGCRFTDWSSSSYRREVSFNIPPTKLIHIDIDAKEVGKNYPATVGLVADARRGALRSAERGQAADQNARLAQRRLYPGNCPSARGVVRHAQADSRVRFVRVVSAGGGSASPARDGIVVTGAVWCRTRRTRNFRWYGPRQHITSGGFSTMGIHRTGCHRCEAGSGRTTRHRAGLHGDFLQTVQELAVAVQLDAPVVFVVLNNFGFSSIRNLQEGHFGKDRTIVTEFKRKGQDYSPHLANVASAFGIRGERVEDPARIAPAVRDACQWRAECR